METETVITDKLSINPSLLKDNIKDVLLRQVKEEYKDICTKKYGYILDVLEVISYTQEPFSRVSSWAKFIVKFTVRNLLPEKDVTAEGIVSHISKRHLVFCVQDRINILVKAEDILKSGFKYNEAESCFEKKYTKLSIGDVVSAKIQNIKFDKNYVCIGDNFNMV